MFHVKNKEGTKKKRKGLVPWWDEHDDDDDDDRFVSSDKEVLKTKTKRNNWTNMRERGKERQKKMGTLKDRVEMLRKKGEVREANEE